MRRLVLAASLALALPTGLKLGFHAPLPWWLIVLYAAVKLGLEYAAATVPPQAPESPCLRRVLRGMLRAPCGTVLALLLALVLLAGLLMTPYSAYDIWHRSLADATPGGAVSTLYCLLGLLLGVAAATLALRGRPLAATWLALLFTAGILALAFQRFEWYLLLALLAAAGSLLLAVPPGPRITAAGDTRGRRLSLARLGFSLILLLAAVAGAVLIVLPTALRSGGHPGGSRLVSDRLHPGLRQAAVGLFPRFPLLYGIPGYGYGFSERRLGGTPALSEAPLFEVAAGPPGWTAGFPTGFLYLRTAAYDSYDGSSWSQAARSEGSQPLGPTVETAAQPPPGALRITLLAELYTQAPHTLDTRRLLLPPETAGTEAQMPALQPGRAGPEGGRVVSGGLATGYELSPPWRRGESLYLVRGSPWPVRLSASELALYRGLPGDLSGRLSELARTLRGPGGDPVATLNHIQEFLAGGYAYNLKAPLPRAGEDFVEAFLFRDREGYCVHFASAFVVLARLAGLPARYAVGFLVAPAGPPDPAETAPRAVSGLSAHAWAEVWLEDPEASPGEGFWGTWEATTALNPLYRDQRPGAAGLNRLTRRQLGAILGRPLAVQPRQRGPRLPALPAPWPIILAVLTGLLLAAALAFSAARSRVLLFVVPTGSARGDRRLVRTLLTGRASRGLPAPTQGGWTPWCGQLAARLALAAVRAARLRELLLRFAYSDRPLSPRDRRYLRAFCLRYGRPH